MEPGLITLIINLVLGLFILIGFLSGLRGIKKSTFGLVMFIIELLVVFLVSPAISKLVLGISISGKTINAHILDAVNDIIGPDLASTDFVAQIVDSVPVMVANIVVSILCIVVFALIFKLIGLIIYKIMFRKDKEKVIEKCEIVDGAPQMVKKTVKKKKHRLAGGVVGAVHGFIFACAMFLPLLGLVNIFNETTMPKTASAEAGIELQYMEDIIRDNIPKEILDFAEAIGDSILYKAGTIGNISEGSFNIVSRTTLNGQTISLGEEIRAIVDSYNAFVDFATTSSSTLSDKNIETIFNDLIENPQNYDFNKLYTLVDKLFESNIVNAMGKDALKLAGDMVVEGAKDEDSLKIATHIKSALYNYAESNHSLKEDFVSLVGVFEISAKNGLLNLLNEETVEISEITNILLNDENSAENLPKNKVLKQIAEKLTSSYLLQKFVVEFANLGINEFESIMNDRFDTTNQILLTKIDSSKDYSISSTELENLIVDLINVYEVIEGLDIDAIEADIYNAFDTDIETVIRSVGSFLNNFVKMSILNDTGVFASICDAMAQTEFNQFISFEELKSAGTIKNQFNYIADSVKEIKDSGIINTIRYMNESNLNESIDILIDQLAANVDGNTYVSKIISPLLKCSILKNGLEYVLGEAHGYIENQLISLNPNIRLVKFNTTGLMTESENAKFIGVLNNIIQYASEISTSDLGGDNFVETIVYSNLEKLGIAFDSVKASTLFADYNNGQGVYKDLMDALAQTEFSQYFDFSVAKSEDFTWSSVTAKLLAVRTELDNVVVNDGGDEIKILKYIFTRGDYETLIDSLHGNNVNLKGVFEIDLIKPTSIKVINIINSKIKEFVSDELKGNITELDLTAKIFEQAESIDNVINNALLIDFNNININNLGENLDEIVDLLEALKQNANLKINNESVGVFKQSYNALLIDISNTIIENIKDSVDESLAEDIVLISSNKNIVNESDDIISILTKAQDVDFDSLNIDELEDNEKRGKLNELLVALETNAINNGVFKDVYNVLLLKTINIINDGIKTTVGNESAGVNITIINSSLDVLPDSQKIRSIVNDVITLYGKIKNINISTLNTKDFFDFVDIFKNNTMVAGGAFANTYNSLLVYVVNSVNTKISDAIGEPYNVNIEMYTGNTNITASYNYIVEVVESATSAFSSLQEGQKIEDVETTKLNRFRTALNNCPQTKSAYDAVEDYLIGKIVGQE